MSTSYSSILPFHAVHLFTISKHLFSDDKDTALDAGREGKYNIVQVSRNLEVLTQALASFLCVLREGLSLFHF